MNPGSGDKEDEQEDVDATQPVDNAHVEVRTKDNFLLRVSTKKGTLIELR